MKPDPDRLQSIKVSHGNLTITGYPLGLILGWAYHVPGVQLDMPRDIGAEHFDVMAKSDSEVPEEQVRAMLRTLLAERFKLVAHRETREMEVTVIPPLKDTARLTPSTSEEFRATQHDRGRLILKFEHTTMAEVASYLSGIGPQTIDRTGLVGRYDFSVPYGGFIDRSGTPDDDPDTPEGVLSTAAVFRAWREAIPAALGIKLERRRIPLDVVVVDHIEREPIPN